MKRRTIVSGLSAAVLAFPITTLVWLGCGGSDSTTLQPPLPTPDAQPPVTVDAAQDTGTGDADSDAGDAGDASPESDAGDAGDTGDTGDAGDAGDAGPTVIREVGTIGFFGVESSYVEGQLFENGVAFRMSSGHPCGAYVQSASPTYLSGGDLQVTGGLIGNADAGGLATSPLLVSPSGPDNYYEWFPSSTEVLFDTATSATIQVSTLGSMAVPAIAAQTLSTPTNGTLTVTNPVVPDGGSMQTIVVSASEDYQVVWTPPATPMATSVLFRIAGLNPNLSANNKFGTIQCIFPIADGTGTVPAALLTAVRNELGGPSSNGNITVNVADAKVVQPGGTGRVIVQTVNYSASTFDGAYADLP
jgi:hypothetical protein